MKIVLTTPTIKILFTMFLFLVIIGSAAHTLATKTYAQELISELTITPPVSYLQIKPGSKARHTITIENTGDSSLEVTPRAVDFTANGVSGMPMLSETTTFPYFQDAEQLFKPITLESGKKAQLTIQFSVPQTAPEKEFPLSIIFTAAPEKPDTDSSLASVTSGVASNVIVLVSNQNTLQQTLEVTNYDLSSVIDSFSPITANPVAKNNRFSTTTASGSATLKNWRGKVVAEYSVYPDNILGFSSRALRFVTKDSLSNPENVVPTPFTYDPLFFMGPYTLEISFIDPTSTSVSVHSKTIVVFPYKILLVVLGGIGLWFALKFYEKKQQKQF